ncbi:unnamed protein product [Cryptosporidium hominis]|uniref:Uncharacterized protein n=1 Tax=Cryptosporidium hominis TaxID=237895 RepID=A0A0S4TIS3_CRYHO|nr:hypothetical protein [Cryptosporidium hominis TU502]OLQ18943.1 hypothetical protein ChTU502y2012_415g0335 [Cryptosporidium hominis]PPA63591.1 hypothetical protein ChUKH1_08625 [Cryptosporidium hominis]PPS97795.1 Uncharacterized protein GY17_00000382 [Cryptosporidium hominis]CUV06793.1 unnamed protein product [Cryptosporidium hominis]|eukprot:PPS97795.1 Uncharacterized protein GY17_00000382 [Cryptosporidium hominis]
MKETYIEIAHQIGKGWNTLSKYIQRSVNAISHLLATLELHFSDDIICNQTSEETLQSSRFNIINDLTTRIKNLSSELRSYVSQFFKEHFSNLEKTIKWINDEYSTFNHYNSDKDSKITSIKRVQVLHNSLKLCTLIKSNYDFILSFTCIIANNIDEFVQQKLIDSNKKYPNKSSTPFDNKVLDEIRKIENFNCYNCQAELEIISNYLEKN